MRRPGIDCFDPLSGLHEFEAFEGDQLPTP
jgi:hypothetical protein